LIPRIAAKRVPLGEICGCSGGRTANASTGGFVWAWVTEDSAQNNTNTALMRAIEFMPAMIVHLLSIFPRAAGRTSPLKGRA
jgi:hypothetical protein